MKNDTFAIAAQAENTRLLKLLSEEKIKSALLEGNVAIVIARLNAIVDCYETLVARSERRVIELRGAHKGMQRLQRKLRAAQSEVLALKGAVKNVREMRDQSEDALRARMSMDEVNRLPVDVKCDLRHGKDFFNA